MYPWLTEDTWIISDTHFFHKRIMELADRPLNHMNLMLTNWNTVIGCDDEVLHLGDVSLGKPDQMRDIAPLLTGNVHVIKGNHDSRRKLRNYMGFDALDLEEIKHNGLLYRFITKRFDDLILIFSHKPIPLKILPGGYHKNVYNIHGHIHNNQAPDFYLDDGRYINMCVEMWSYMPTKLGKILSQIKEKRNER